MIKRVLFIICLIFSLGSSKAQCPQVFDYLGNLSSNPYWISCTGNAYNLNFQSNASWGTYTLNWGDGSPVQTGASYTGGTILTHNYSATVDTFVVTLIIPALNCTLTGVVVMEKPVNASIQIPIGGVTQACAPATLAFINSSTDVSQTTHFQWNFGDGSPLSNHTYTNAGTTISHTYNKGTVNCQTQVTLLAWNYCSQGNTTIATYNPIQIYDIDNAAITPNAFIKCWPDNVFTFTNTTQRNCLAQGNTFQRQEWWNFGNYWGLNHDSIINWKPWPPTSPLTIAYPAVGTYSVMLRDSNLCGIDTAIIFVSIVNPPTAALVAPAGPNCVNAPITFSNTSPAGYSYLWNFGTGGGFVNLGTGPKTFTYTAPGVYTVQLAAFIPGAGAACTNTAAVTVTILPSPVANFVHSPTVGCVTLNNVNFNESSIDAVSWNWNFGNGNTSTLQSPPAQNYTNTGSFVISLSVTGSNTCVHTKTANVIVHPDPVANFSPTVACVGSVTNFTNLSTVTGTTSINSYTWDFGDGSANSFLQNPSHSYTAAALYTVQLTVSTAFCTNTVVKNFLANVKPTANFAFTPTVSCPPFPVTFSNTTLNGITYLWNFGTTPTATSSAANPTFTFNNTTQANQNFTVTLTALTPAGCVDSIKQSLMVYPKPVSSFTGNLNPGCSPLPVTFSNTTVGATTYSWSFGDGNSSTVMNPSHTFTNNSLLLQTSTVQLVSTNSVGCTDTTSNIVTIFPEPFFTFTMIPASGCTPLSVNFPPVLGAVSYTWNFGDGTPNSSSSNPTHVFTNTTTSNQSYTVTLMASNAFGCLDTTYGNPMVFPAPVANFSATPNTGCPPLVVSFTNTSIGNNSVAWDFNNGQASILINPTITFTAPSGASAGTYSVKLLVGTANNCYDSIVKTVSLFARPKAEFALDTPACSPKVMTFTNTSVGSTTYSWNLGDGGTSTATNPVHTYNNTTPFNQTLTVTLIATNSNNCRDTIRKPMAVHPKPQFFISALPDSGCTPLKVFFPPIVGVQQYQWNYNDGNTANTGSVSNTFVNVGSATKLFTVTLIARDIHTCADTTTRIIKVFPKPVAFFKADPTTVFVPNQATEFSNLSSGAVNYQWTFGDGGTSSEFSPSHTYVTPGEYDVMLVSTSIKGCRDTFHLPEKIVAMEESALEIPNAFSPNPAGSPGTVFDPKDKSNDIWHPNIRGASRYTLSIYSRWGELLFETKNPEEGWDGYYKGKLCTQDVYVWKIVATFIDGKNFTKTGDLLLMR
ncbi:MAG: Microbial collagenase precursor [Bacteroidetes bacterium]|jgi:gliding motility-associated-like protein|nr:Microbial collagenase precursor [Bacteroidota bacterium]